MSKYFKKKCHNCVSQTQFSIFILFVMEFIFSLQYFFFFLKNVKQICSTLNRQVHKEEFEEKNQRIKNNFQNC